MSYLWDMDGDNRQVEIPTIYEFQGLDIAWDRVEEQEDEEENA